MEYRSYMHIEKLGNSAVEGILNGVCYVSYKVDGTNAVVWLREDGTLGFGSRNRELASLQEDNGGFLKFMLSEDYAALHKDLLAYLTKYPNRVIYGEWLVKHTLQTYAADAWKKFYVFDIYDADTDSYVNYDEYSVEFGSYPNIDFIPILAKIDNPTVDQLKALLNKTGDWLVTIGLGEGIVIKNYAYKNKYGWTKWGKLLTEDFLKNKGVKNSINTRPDPTFMEIEIIKLMTAEHILKEKAKIKLAHDGWDSKHIYELLNRSFNEFWRDNWEIILKKFKMPTINFLNLKKLSDEKVKEVLNQII